MPKNKKKIGECTVGCANDVLQLVVLISGTTDPVNSFTDDDHGARSYRQEKRTTYWDTAFYDGIQALVKANPNAKLFDFHGWSGDNRKGNREVAGAYLVNRLVGANKEEAFYGPRYQKKTIHIHMVGHSHGGNVINEMTQQMEKLGSTWPATWKVKSFTYLSTPFFQKLHQVKVGSFVHPQAEVLNVYNDYDMTQRMLADFSLFTLHDVIDANGLTEAINSNLDQLMATFKAVPWDLGTDFYLTEKEGRRLYTATRDFLGDFEDKVVKRIGVIKFLKSIEAIAVGLNKPVEYKVDPGLKANNKVTHSYQLLSDAHLANLKRVIKALVASINLSLVGLNEGLSANSFSRAGFIAALFRGSEALANNLAAFLNVPTGKPNVGTSGVLWQTLVGVLSDAIEVFDNTVTKPDAQFNSSRTITPLNVTSKDKYHNSAQKANCLKLMKKIEALEKRATAKPDANLLFDLVLILMVHDPKVRGFAKDFREWASWINAAEVFVSGELDTTLKAVRATMTNMSNALLDRFVGEIEDATDTHPDKEMGRRGSLPYLLKESHSTSRRVLLPEVKAFLQLMMG